MITRPSGIILKIVGFLIKTTSVSKRIFFYKLTQPPYSCFRPTNTTVATEATMVASKPNVVATAAIRNHKVNGGPGMYFSILAKIKNMMTNITIFVSKS